MSKLLSLEANLVRLRRELPKDGELSWSEQAESLEVPPQKVFRLTFQDAQLRLVAYVRDRIRNGELTERAFARQIGISQPHAHNVLKGVRNLSPEILDAVLRHFRLSLLDLAPESSLEACLEQRQARKRSVQSGYVGFPLDSGVQWPQST
ncbi:MAG TPA: helix-turn-helix transcriptional regulator [Bryobacteraceae bacterium]|nr:helix-turn-helix transcriptional regulator [Bryobacteraceae bacterium]